MAVAAPRRRFTADDYQRMGEAGILATGDRVELLDGEIVAMTPIGPRHGAAVDRAARALILRLSDAAIVRVQGSVRLDAFNEPEPDIVVLKPREDFYASVLPGPADILLIIEVSDSSASYDRSVKSSLYARMGVAEYWLADLTAGVVTCHAAPADGMYRELRQVQRGQSLAPLLLSDCTILAADLLS
jgi:Uma2 family endonuclease